MQNVHESSSSHNKRYLPPASLFPIIDTTRSRYGGRMRERREAWIYLTQMMKMIFQGQTHSQNQKLQFNLTFSSLLLLFTCDCHSSWTLALIFISISWIYYLLPNHLNWNLELGTIKDEMRLSHSSATQQNRWSELKLNANAICNAQFQAVYVVCDLPFFSTFSNLN
jgi:hypothetical protein